MYEQFFGLAEEPFRLTADPRFFYLSPKHAEALAHLRLGLTESSGFVCITGEVGTGKTTLLRAFLAELGPNVSAAYTFVPPLSAFELLRRICIEFGIEPPSTQSDLLDALQSFLVAQHAAGRICVVVLDEAQALSIELLEQVRLLLNFETPTEKLLRIVLVGQPQLRKLLLDPDLAQLNQRITLRWHLGPLSYRQTVAYVKHRIEVAGQGRAAAGLFTRPALRLLHSVAGGVPRLINMVAHRALLTAFVEKRPRIQRRSVAHAYREIQTVPLPGTLSLAYRAGVAVAGLAVGMGLMAVGIPRFGGLSSTPPTTPSVATVMPVGVEEPSRMPAEACEPIASVATALVPAEPVLAPATVSSLANPVLAPATVSSLANPVLAPAPASSTAEPVLAPATVSSTVASAPRLAGAELAARVEAGGSDATAASSIERMLAAWSVAPLSSEERAQIADLETIAWRRGLQVVALTGNRSMLRLLDLPVQLRLRVAGDPAPRFATVVAMDGPDMMLDLGDGIVRVDATHVEGMWTGQARLVWRDVAGLPPLLSQGARGPGVMHLQDMLHRIGAFEGAPSGIFDPETASAVVAFQRAHQLEPDGIVGSFTRIVLYAALDDHERPTLALAKADPS